MTSDDERPIARLPADNSSQNELVSRSIKAIADSRQGVTDEPGSSVAADEARQAYLRAVDILTDLRKTESGMSAEPYLLLSAQLEYAQAKFILGMLRGGSWKCPVNLEEQVAWLESAASENIVASALALGEFYVDGNAIWSEIDEDVLEDPYNIGFEVWPNDPVKAIQWLSKAADGGSIEAKRLLGDVYLYIVNNEGHVGSGIDPSSIPVGTSGAAVECLRWYMDAAENGCVASSCVLGMIYSLASTGRSIVFSAGGRLLLGNYALRDHDFPSDDDEAEKWLRKSVEGKFRAAVVPLARFLLKRRLKSFDMEEAVDLLEHAASRNDVVAQFELGKLYLQGDGVPADRLKAIQLLLMSTDSSLGPAHDFLWEAVRSGLLLESEVEHSEWWEGRHIQFDSIFIYAGCERRFWRRRWPNHLL